MTDVSRPANVGLGSRLCENAQEPTRRRIVFSIALFPIAATALFVFRLTKSRRTFYAQIECLCFHTASTDSRSSICGPDVLDGALAKGGGFLVERRFTVADVNVAGVTFYLRHNPEVLAGRTAIRNWQAAAMVRPAWKKAFALRDR